MLIHCYNLDILPDILNRPSLLTVVVMVSLVVKTHVHDILARVKDISSELGDLEIVASNGSFLTSKLMLFSSFPQIVKFLCKSSGCGETGHDTITILVPDRDVEDVSKAFEKFFLGSPQEILEIFGFKEVDPSRNKSKNTEKDDRIIIPFKNDEYKRAKDHDDDSDSDSASNYITNNIKTEDEEILSIEINPYSQIQNEKRDQIKKLNSIDNIGSQYSCRYCGKSYVTKKKLNRHIRDVHEKRLGILRPTKGYSCECGVYYTTFRSYKYCECKTKKRMRVSNKEKENDPWNKCRYKCELCEKIYLDKLSLRTHIKHKHQLDYLNEYIQRFGNPDKTNENPKWVCSLCPATVKFERRVISEHLETKHSLGITKYGERYGVPSKE